MTNIEIPGSKMHRDGKWFLFHAATKVVMLKAFTSSYGVKHAC
jgi:hypothetical protein